MEAEDAAARLEPTEPKLMEPEEEEYEEPEEENVGQWSPRPLEPEHVVGQDVIPEEEDARLLDLLRKKVRTAVGLCFVKSTGVIPNAIAGKCVLGLLHLWSLLDLTANLLKQRAGWSSRGAFSFTFVSEASGYCRCTGEVSCCAAVQPSSHAGGRSAQRRRQCF